MLPVALVSVLAVPSGDFHIGTDTAVSRAKGFAGVALLPDIPHADGGCPR